MVAELGKMKALYEEKLATFWRRKIADCNGNTRRLWQTFREVLGFPSEFIKMWSVHY